MYRNQSENQLNFNDFVLPFGGHLNENNRWVILSKKIPWSQLEQDYAVQFADSEIGSPAKSFRMAFGALIIKEKLQISDEEVVEQIQETPYLQFFIGYDQFSSEPPFDPSMMVHFRKRLGGELIQKINELLFKEYQEKLLKKNRKIRKKLKKIKG
jgi:IS5 family transposase